MGWSLRRIEQSSERKVDADQQIIGRDPQTGTRKYHKQTIHGSFREAQRFLNLKLQQRDPGCASRAAAITLTTNHFCGFTSDPFSARG